MQFLMDKNNQNEQCSI